MSTACCERCGATYHVNRTSPHALRFCSLGCALRARVPVDAKGNFPVNGALATALVIGFVYFNQLMFWGLAELALRQGRLPVAERFSLAVGGAAVVVWLVVLVSQVQTQTLRGKDVVLALVVLLLIAVGLSRWPAGGEYLASANAALLIWNARGVFRVSSNV